MSEGCEWPKKVCRKGSHMTWAGKDEVGLETWRMVRKDKSISGVQSSMSRGMMGDDSK